MTQKLGSRSENVHPPLPQTNSARENPIGRAHGQARPGFFATPVEWDSGAVRDPDVRLLIGAALTIEVDHDRRQRTFKRVSA